MPQADWIEHGITLALLPALLTLSWIDFRDFRLPDRITLPMIALGIWTNSVFLGAPLGSLAGAALGYGALLAVELTYKRLRGRDGLGRGDAKLLAAAGAWCTALYLPFILLVASASALLFALLLGLVRGRLPSGQDALAFGPWLALGFYVCWLFRAYMPVLY